MAVPVSNTIIDHVVSTIAAITAGDTYERTVKVCERLTFLPSEIAQYDAVFVYDNGFTKDYLTSQTRVVLNLLLDCWIQDDDPATAIDQLAADIEKALSVDLSRNDNALDTKIVAGRKYVSEEMRPEANCELDIEITYRHTEGDPYTKVS
jgi:hypothetical protein